MKRIISVLLAVLVITSFSVSNTVFASNDYCDFTESYEHEFQCTVQIDEIHPHPGFFECECGLRIYFNDSYDFWECDKCKEELCYEGIHDYGYDIHNTEDYNGYGICRCGKGTCFSSNINKNHFSKDFYGILEIFDRKGTLTYIQANHPHLEMERFGNYLESIDYDATWHVRTCGICALEEEYNEKAAQFNIDYVLRTYTFLGTEEEYDRWCETEYYEDEEFYDEWDENETYDYGVSYPSDDDLYEWLDIVKDILG